MLEYAGSRNLTRVGAATRRRLLAGEEQPNHETSQPFSSASEAHPVHPARLPARLRPGARRPSLRRARRQTITVSHRAEVLAFLETADVVSTEEMSAGTNKKKRKVELEKNGIRVRGIHRNTYDYRDMAGVGFVDSYLSEMAAYELSRILGLDFVPPVVKRKVKKMGSLQLWIEGATTEADRLRGDIEPPDAVRFQEQIDVLRVFDNLIANTDRNPGNIIIDSDWRVWFIDHTRSFAGYRELREPDKIVRCERGVWQKLQTVSDAEIKSRLKPYAPKYLSPLVARRELVVDKIRQLIAENGEDQVIFDWSEGLSECSSSSAPALRH